LRSTGAPEPGRFGLLLRRQRLAACLSQEELAALAGLSPRSIGNLERGRVRRPRPRSVRLLGTALGLTGAELASFEAIGRSAYWRRGDDAPAALISPQPAGL
jgi:transcriptional regulator with XRE-family HTH domain